MTNPNSRQALPLLLILLCTFVVSPIISAQVIVTSVDIIGNSFFSERSLRDRISVKPGAPLTSLKQTILDINNLYRTEGFYSFTVDSTVIEYIDDSTRADVRIFINEGMRTLVASVTLSGNSIVSSMDLQSLIETSVGSPLNESRLESDIKAILTFYARNGYPFASISSDSIHSDADEPEQLHVQLQINEGSPVTLQEIRVDGNTSTVSSVIVREARLVNGELFNQDKLGTVRRRLERLQLFSSVSDPHLYVVPTASSDTLRGGLLITVKEGSTNTFDGIIGYVPSTVPNTEGYVTGNVFVAMRNLFGTGRKALIRWQRETALTQELELQYKEPWLFGIPLSAGGTFYQRKQDSSYVKTKIDFRGEFMISEDLTVSGTVTNETVYPSSSLQQFTVFESDAVYFGAELLYDSRDYPMNPTEGIRYSTAVQQGRKNISGPKRFLSLLSAHSQTIRKFTFDSEVYLSTFQRQVIMAGIHGKHISSTRLDVSDLFQFGGTTTLRGYRENQFFASQIAYINLEYRFLTGRASSFYGFFDGGYYSRPDDPVTGIAAQENNLYGFGIGARVETALGVLNMNYALGEGDSFSNGKIHVGINNEF